MFKITLISVLLFGLSGSYLYWGTGPQGIEKFDLTCVPIWKGPPQMPFSLDDLGPDDGRSYIFGKQLTFFENYNIYARACEQMAARNSEEALALFDSILTSESSDYKCSSLYTNSAWSRCVKAQHETKELFAISTYYMAVTELTLNSDCTAGIDLLNKSLSFEFNKEIRKGREEILSRVREDCFGMSSIDRWGLNLRTWVRKTSGRLN